MFWDAPKRATTWDVNLLTWRRRLRHWTWGSSLAEKTVSLLSPFPFPSDLLLPTVRSVPPSPVSYDTKSLRPPHLGLTVKANTILLPHHPEEKSGSGIHRNCKKMPTKIRSDDRFIIFYGPRKISLEIISGDIEETHQNRLRKLQNPQTGKLKSIRDDRKYITYKRVGEFYPPYEWLESGKKGSRENISLSRVERWFWS